MSFEFTNHDTGAIESPGIYYQTQRILFKEQLSMVRDEYKLLFIEKEYKTYSDLLEKKSPELFERLKNPDDKPMANDCFIETDSHLALFSYIKFIIGQYVFYKEIERINFIDVKWLGEYNKLVELYEVLSKYNYIESNFADFKRFWSLNLPMKFSCNIYETVVLFYELEENSFVADSTIESMIKNCWITAQNGKTRNYRVITWNDYTKNKSKYIDKSPDQYPTNNFFDAIQKFGITLKVKK